MDPLSLLCRLATSVPPPRHHTVKYAGALASASPWRARSAPGPTDTDVTGAFVPTTCAALGLPLGADDGIELDGKPLPLRKTT
jgi:hypothetical protein